jgi:hypothetical protein
MRAGGEGIEGRRVYEIATTFHVLDQITRAENITLYSRTAVMWGQWPGTWTHQSTYAVLSRQQGTQNVASHESAGPRQEDLVALTQTNTPYMFHQQLGVLLIW